MGVGQELQAPQTLCAVVVSLERSPQRRRCEKSTYHRIELLATFTHLRQEAHPVVWHRRVARRVTELKPSLDELHREMRLLLALALDVRLRGTEAVHQSAT